MEKPDINRTNRTYDSPGRESGHKGARGVMTSTGVAVEDSARIEVKRTRANIRVRHLARLGHQARHRLEASTMRMPKMPRYGNKE